MYNKILLGNTEIWVPAQTAAPTCACGNWSRQITQWGFWGDPQPVGHLLIHMGERELGLGVGPLNGMTKLGSMGSLISGNTPWICGLTMEHLWWDWATPLLTPEKG